MKIFSRIATCVALVFLISATVFNFIHNAIFMGILGIVFTIIFLIISVNIGIWRKDTWNAIE